jgi:hypothetical protein
MIVVAYWSRSNAVRGRKSAIMLSMRSAKPNHIIVRS